VLTTITNHATASHSQSHPFLKGGLKSDFFVVRTTAQRTFWM